MFTAAFKRQTAARHLEAPPADTWLDGVVVGEFADMFESNVELFFGFCARKRKARIPVR
jgi:hypothetical protein